MGQAEYRAKWERMQYRLRFRAMRRWLGVLYAPTLTDHLAAGTQIDALFAVDDGREGVFSYRCPCCRDGVFDVIMLPTGVIFRAGRGEWTRFLHPEQPEDVRLFGQICATGRCPDHLDLDLEPCTP